MLIYYENDVKEASKMKKQVTLQQQEVESMDHQTTTQVLFQQSSYHPLAQHSATLSQFQSPVQDLCSAYRDSLQAHRPSSLLSGSVSSSLHSYSALQASLQSAVQTLPLQAPITMQVAIATEPRHCISMAYGSSYFSGHHSYTARCFDRWPSKKVMIWVKSEQRAQWNVSQMCMCGETYSHRLKFIQMMGLQIKLSNMGDVPAKIGLLMRLRETEMQ